MNRRERECGAATVRAATSGAAVSLLTVALVASMSGPARANPMDLFGYGARAAAMAGAQTAASNDSGAGYYNPAILATFDYLRIDVGYQYAAPTLLVGGLDTEVDAGRGLTAGLAIPGHLFNRKLAIGLAIYLPDQHMSRIRTLSSQKPRFAVYDNRPQRLFIAQNVGVEVTDRLYFGGGVAVMSGSKGTITLAGRVGFPNADDSDLALATDIDFLGVRYLQGGLYYRAAPWLDIGLSYRGSFTLTLEQTFRIEGNVGSADAAPLVEDAFFELQTISQDLFQPAQVTIGADAQLTPRLALALDLGWHRWSAFTNPAARINIELDIGTFNDLVNIQPAPPLPTTDFRDVLVPRVALEWTALNRRRTEVKVRGGYVYEPSPVPWQFGETNYIDNDKHTVSVGAGVILRNLTEILPRPMSLDVSFAYTGLKPRNHIKISPIDPIGSYRSTGRIVQGALSTRWQF